MVILRVPFEGKVNQEIEVVAHIFDVQGNLLESAPVKEEHVQLALNEKQTGRVRIFLAPVLPEGRDEKPTLENLERNKAYEPVWKFNPNAKIQELAAIPEMIWKYWLFCRCRIRGQVVRPVNIGGTVQDLPICRARVHICEVDRLIDTIFRVPDDVIRRLRDELVLVLEQPMRFPVPLPDPPPFKFDPRITDPSPVNLAALNRLTLPETARGVSGKLALRSGSLQPAIAAPVRAAAATDLNPQPLPPRLPQLSTLKLDTQLALSSPSIAVVRQALVENVQLLRPFICIWDWFWVWYRCDEVAVVTTDEQGNFDSTIWYRCFVDQPDLYFWVEYFIGGVWTTVYRPSIGCHTYWNYQCGTQVTLRVTDPRVIPCSQPPDLAGLQVAVLSIGNGVSLNEIQGVASGAAVGLTTDGEPFGGVLEPHVFFSRTALFAAGITHYRWSYRRLTASNGTPVSDIWHAMNRDVVRHYAVIDPVTSDLSFPADLMGPDPNYAGKDLYRIQPLNPPAPGVDWVVLDAREDLATAFFETHLLEGGNAAIAAGQYELKLELFKPTTSAVTPVNLTATGIQLKVPTIAAPFGPGTVPTAAPGTEHLVLDGSGNVLGFRMVVRVDNNPCEAEIYPVTNPSGSSGLTVDVDCGFIEYANTTVTTQIAFKARHPHNFATFNFDIYRGSSIPVPEASASGSVGSISLNGFNRDPASGVFSKNTVTVQTLLTSNKTPGSPDCQKAAFAETLQVRAMATDGWGQLSYLNASGIPKAFALAPFA